MQYIVKWSKEFVNGNLKGIWYDTELSFSSLELACNHVNYCHAHKTKPVKAINSSDYLCHMARIETREV